MVFFCIKFATIMLPVKIQGVRKLAVIGRKLNRVMFVISGLWYKYDFYLKVLVTRS